MARPQWWALARLPQCRGGATQITNTPGGDRHLVSNPILPSPAQRLALRERPDGPAAMYQTWQHLLFLHWEADPAVIASRLPPGLHPDLFDGRAYLGLVPFFMRRVRPRHLPAVPGLSNFYEMNVRTYVHDREGIPGVWFFSLDASNAIACAVARARFHLSYFDAAIRATKQDWIRFHAIRRGRDTAAEFRYRGHGPPREAAPGTLDFFLVERYALYAHHPEKGHLYRGRVHHAPYRLHEAEAPRWSTLPVAWDDLPEPSGPPVHSCYAERVDVEVFGLEPVTNVS